MRKCTNLNIFIRKLKWCKVKRLNLKHGKEQKEQARRNTNYVARKMQKSIKLGQNENRKFMVLKHFFKKFKTHNFSRAN